MLTVVLRGGRFEREAVSALRFKVYRGFKAVIAAVVSSCWQYPCSLLASRWPSSLVVGLHQFCVGVASFKAIGTTDSVIGRDAILCARRESEGDASCADSCVLSRR
jgi:hypothetical protein